jgi:hypothetical protein
LRVVAKKSRPQIFQRKLVLDEEKGPRPPMILEVSAIAGERGVLTTTGLAFAEVEGDKCAAD